MTIPLPLDSVLLGFSNAGAVSGVFSYSCAVGCGSNSTQQSTETIELSRFKKTGVGNFIIIPTVTGPRADGLRLNSNDEFVVPETRSLVFTASSLTMAENSRLVFNPTLLLGSTHDLAFTQLIVDNATLARRTSIVVRFPVGFKPDLRRNITVGVIVAGNISVETSLIRLLFSFHSDDADELGSLDIVSVFNVEQVPQRSLLTMNLAFIDGQSMATAIETTNDEDPTAPSGGSGVDSAVIGGAIGAIVAVVVICIIVAITVVVVRRARKQRREAEQPQRQQRAQVQVQPNKPIGTDYGAFGEIGNNNDYEVIPGRTNYEKFDTVL